MYFYSKHSEDQVRLFKSSITDDVWVFKNQWGLVWDTEGLFAGLSPDQSFGGNMDDSAKELHTDCHQLWEDTQAFLQEPVRGHRYWTHTRTHVLTVGLCVF